MIKSYLQILLLLILFDACNPGSPPHFQDSSIPDTDLSTAASADIAAAPDTALESLNDHSSLSLEDLLGQTWEMTDADKKHWNEFFWDSRVDSKMYPSLSLFPDFSFTENPRLDIRTGKWSLNKKDRLLILMYSDGTKKSYFIKELSFSHMIVRPQNISDDAELTFTPVHLIHRQFNEDPFYPQNNRWRFRPRTAESKEQIRARVKACVHFYYLFFKDNKQKHSDDISFIGLPKCFVWYDGGIGMASPAELDLKWKQCFYSDDQAEKGYDLVKNVLSKHLIKWPPHEKGWIFQTYTVLDQIYVQL